MPGEHQPHRRPQVSVLELACEVHIEASQRVVVQHRPQPSLRSSTDAQRTLESAVVVHRCGTLKAGLHRNRQLSCGELDLLEPQRALELLQDRQLKRMERVSASVACGVHGAQDPGLHTAVAHHAESPADVGRAGQALELRSEVEEDPCVHFDVRLSDLHPALQAGGVHVKYRLLRGVHEEIPVPPEVRQLLRHPVQHAVLRVESGGSRAPRRKATVVGIDAVYMLHLVHGGEAE
mmetsp:Transcript_18007/g.51134  ORF Transcript_18007/g.51134 Transcript_18007/m.51134 type:complete len:235 (-) Transcript_18007:729-1433(-)